MNLTNTFDSKENDKKHRIRWQDQEETTEYRISFDEVLFKTEGVKILDYQNKPDKHKAKKQNKVHSIRPCSIKDRSIV